MAGNPMQTKTKLDEMIAALDALDPEQLRQLRDALLGRLGEEEMDRRKTAFVQRLVDAGLMDPKELSKSVRAGEDFEPIAVTGPPVSETILAERR